MKRRRMTAEDRKRAIVGAALPLFARQGYAETTTKDLALAAGVSQPLLYKHFPSKEALYREILNFCRHDEDPAVQKLAGLKPSASTLVHLVYLFMRVLVLGKPVGLVQWETRHRLVLNSLLEDGAFARLVFRDRFDCYCSQMEACLDSAIAAGTRSRPRSRRAIARASPSMWEPGSRWWICPPNRSSITGFPAKSCWTRLSGLSCAAWG